MSENEYEDYKLFDEEESECIEADEVIDYLPAKTETLQVKSEKLHIEIQDSELQDKQVSEHETPYEEYRPKNTSFQSYVYKNEKNQHGFKKWMVRCAKLILFLMCLPFIAMVAGFLGFVAATFLGGSVGLLGGGVALLIGTAFFSSYLGGSLIMLGMTSAITLLASGTLGMILFVMILKALIRYLKQYWQKRKQKKVMQEEVNQA